MSRQAIENFLGEVCEDGELQEEYWRALGDAARAAVVGLAAERGYEFTAEELKRAWAEQSEELSDEQLDGVAGGLGGHSLRAVEQSNALFDFAGEVGFFRVAGGVEGFRRP